MEQYSETKITEDFSDFIGEQHPGALKSFLKLEKQINELDMFEFEEGATFEDGDVKVTPLYDKIETKQKHRIQDKYLPNTYMKVEVGEHAFFVKTVNAFSALGNSVQEYNSQKKLSEILKDIPGVEVVEMKLGYFNKRTERQYYVSEWKDLPRVKDIENTNQSLKDRALELSDLLNKRGFFDTHTGNMFYDEKTDTIFVFDALHDSEVF